MSPKTLLLVICLSFLFVNKSIGQDEAKSKEIKVYGHVMTDIGYNFGQINPDWFDVMRPTQLATFDDEFGSDGQVYFSVRQTRFGIDNNIQTKLGNLRIWFEWELFGTGADAGQTTIRLRHAYGELGKIGVGQYWSPFMDIDVFPNSIEYWGPNAMVFFRNIQFRYMPIQGDTRLTFALERPGASGDGGIYADRIELQDISLRFPLPDFSAEYRQATNFGYIELATILRRVEWEDNGTDAFDLSGSVWGWGFNLSSNINFGENTLRIQGVIGEGIQNYVNGGGPDIGTVNQLSNTVSPIKGVAIPIATGLIFLDHRWNEKFTSSIGYSMVNVENTDAQNPTAYKQGRYGLVNLLYYPVEHVMMGGEIQYGGRDNYLDGWSEDIVKLQFSFKYNFSHTFN